MALDSTYQPAAFEFEIQQGAHFHLEFPHFADTASGAPFDFTNDPAGTWTARMDVKAKDGTTVCSFATSGAEGTIVLRADGTVGLDLNDEYTTGLDPTNAYLWASTKNAVYGDLVLINPADGEKWVFYRGIGSIRKQVTA